MVKNFWMVRTSVPASDKHYDAVSGQLPFAKAGFFRCHLTSRLHGSAINTLEPICIFYYRLLTT
jgi:hypothetical protein